ncbi:hypothetical protein RRG08_037616 [Elysia crispata]|uniref:Uncharacterized protein n=1 Tax=Elysia crispata TaxID=231223 RepID=A0AAE0YGJ7_9GAST|nr:hypothetical protein RRG08_037616 [Elysia crispata]
MNPLPSLKPGVSEPSPSNQTASFGNRFDQKPQVHSLQTFWCSLLKITSHSTPNLTLHTHVPLLTPTLSTITSQHKVIGFPRNSNAWPGKRSKSHLSLYQRYTTRYSFVCLQLVPRPLHVSPSLASQLLPALPCTRSAISPNLSSRHPGLGGYKKCILSTKD